MGILEKLIALGFTAEAIPDRSRTDASVYRIRTAKGWTYERFESAEQVDVWAINHRPE